MRNLIVVIVASLLLVGCGGVRSTKINSEDMRAGQCSEYTGKASSKMFVFERLINSARPTIGLVAGKNYQGQAQVVLYNNQGKPTIGHPVYYYACGLPNNRLGEDDSGNAHYRPFSATMPATFVKKVGSEKTPETNLHKHVSLEKRVEVLEKMLIAAKDEEFEKESEKVFIKLLKEDADLSAQIKRIGPVAKADEVYFAYNSAILYKSAKKTLSKVAYSLTRYDVDEVTFKGYCSQSKSGDPDCGKNNSLADRRNEVVAKFLIDLGIKSKFQSLAVGSTNEFGSDQDANQKVIILW